MAHYVRFPHHFCLFLILTAVMLISGNISYAATITISWNANNERDLDGYKVYYGTSPRQYFTTLDVGNITSYHIAGLTGGVRYYIALTAYDTSGNESTRSAEVSGVAIDIPVTTSILGTTSTIPTVTTSTATSSIANTSTTVSTTTLPATTTTIGSATTSTISETTTSTMPEDAPCEEAKQLIPIALEASSEFPRFFPKSNLIDWDPRTAWSTILFLFRPDASITLDLGGLKYITSLSMYATSLFGIDYLPSNIQLQTSNDHISWKSITNASGYTSLQPPYGDSWVIGGEECRYLKMIINGRKGIFLFQLAQIAELEVYGCDTTLNRAAQHRDAEIDRNHRREDLTGSPLLQLSPQRQETDAPSTPGRPVVHFTY